MSRNGQEAIGNGELELLREVFVYANESGDV